MPTPSWLSRQFGRNMRKLREEAKLTGEQAALVIEIDESGISRMEAGKRSVRTHECELLLDAYGVTDPELRAFMINQSQQARQKVRKWWDDFGSIAIPPELRTWLSAEADSSAMLIKAMGIPAMLQTEKYTRGLLRHAQIDENVKLDRIEYLRERKKILAREDCPNIWVVMDESALHRRVGSPDVMREQLDTLANLSHHPKLTLQIVTFDSGIVADVFDTYTIFEFPKPATGLVGVECATGPVYQERFRDVTDRYRAYNEVRAQSASPAESEDLLRRLSRALREGESL